MSMCFEEARFYYKPQKVKVLFIGESPPSGTTFFYYASSNLYRCIRQGFTEVYGRKCGQGKAFLSFFKDCGCYLDDLCLVPVNREVEVERKRLRTGGIESLGARVKEMQPLSVIIAMKGIEKEVRRALHQAGLVTPHVYLNTFPGGSNKNRLGACPTNNV